MRINSSLFLNFKSTFASYVNTKNSGNDRILCYTEPFRSDLNWNKFAKFLNSHFDKEQKVDVVNLGCSDGSEPYTLIMSLDKLGKSAKKFYPIRAYDLNKTLITQANQSLLYLSPFDLDELVLEGIDGAQYFRKAEKISDNGVYIARNSLKKNVHFAHADGLNVLSRMKDDSKNTVVLFRNALTYLTQENQERFFELLGKKLGEGSVFVTGDLEDKSRVLNIDKRLKELGFEKAPDLDLVYIKKKPYDYITALKANVLCNIGESKK